MEILTTTLRNGRKVLAKNTEFGIHPIRYANNKQASNKVDELNAFGIKAWYSGFGHVKYVYINENN